MTKIIKYNLQFDRPDHNIIRIIDCYMGRVNGFAYGSMQRLIKMKRKGVIKPVGPVDQYRLPPATSNEVWMKLSVIHICVIHVHANEMYKV